MANTATQSLANHTRFDPPFHFFLLPLGLVAIILSVIRIIHRPTLASTLLLILSIGFVMIAAKTRGYSLRVQDRVIRLEERLRLAMLMPEAGRARCRADGTADEGITGARGCAVTAPSQRGGQGQPR